MTNSNPFILCIEDDESSRFILHKLIVDIMKYSDAEIWPNTVDFENKINELKKIPSLILVDIKMAPLDGFAVLHLLRQNENFQNTVIVAFTASIMPEQVNKLKKAGFNGLISKPVVRHLFPKILDSLLAGESLWYIS